MKFEQLTVKELVAPLESRQRDLEQEYLNNYNALLQKQAQGFADDNEEVQEFARNLQIIEAAHSSVTSQIVQAKKDAAGSTKDQKVDLTIPVEIVPEEVVESEEVVAP